jgi:hypothetical protein
VLRLPLNRIHPILDPRLMQLIVKCYSNHRRATFLRDEDARLNMELPDY